MNGDKAKKEDAVYDDWRFTRGSADGPSVAPLFTGTSAQASKEGRRLAHESQEVVFMWSLKCFGWSGSLKHFPWDAKHCGEVE